MPPKAKSARAARAAPAETPEPALPAPPEEDAPAEAPDAEDGAPEEAWVREDDCDHPHLRPAAWTCLASLALLFVAALLVTRLALAS